MDCGPTPAGLEDARAGKHTYAEYRIFGDLSLVLCDICQVDFASYDPTFFGLPRGTPIGMRQQEWQFIHDVPVTITKDKCCTACGYRLPFLWFVLHARELHNEE